MTFKEVYTTQELIALDKTGKEELKIKITMDIYALLEVLDKLSERIHQLKGALQ